mgnify:CR=1 FL=1
MLGGTPVEEISLDYLPIAISVLSLAVAATTLFLAQFRSPRISIHVGPTVKLYYPKDGGFAAYIPTTFINDSARMGAVFRTAISLVRNENPQDRFFIEWGSFSTYDPQTGNWRYEDMAHALAVPGKAAVNKLLWFNWLPSSSPLLHIREGEYTLTVHYWTAQTGNAANDIHNCHISGETFVKLESYRTAGKATIVEVVLDRQLDQNRLMTPHEAKALLNV